MKPGVAVQEHVLPLLAGIEESDDIDGLLLLLNTVGGDIEAGLAIAELVSEHKNASPFSTKEKTVSYTVSGSTDSSNEQL